MPSGAVNEIERRPVKRAKMRRWVAKGRRFVRGRILGVDDTPHRIAFGVFLGFLVGATPTLGFQMVIYWAIAWVVRANKVTGIAPIWLSNPITAVPLYYFNWRVGVMLTGSGVASGSGAALVERLTSATKEFGSFSEGFGDLDYWMRIGQVLWDLGLELWIGSLAVGLVAGALGYALAYHAVVSHRLEADERKARRQGR